MFHLNRSHYCLPFPLSPATAMVGIILAGVLTGGPAYGWPAASLKSRHENCMSCHEPAGQWTDTTKVIIDIIDPVTNESFRSPDGSFEIPVRRGECRVFSLRGRS